MIVFWIAVLLTATPFGLRLVARGHRDKDVKRKAIGSFLIVVGAFALVALVGYLLAVSATSHDVLWVVALCLFCALLWTFPKLRGLLFSLGVWLFRHRLLSRHHRHASSTKTLPGDSPQERFC